jgi:hypothetical protein
MTEGGNHFAFTDNLIRQLDTLAKPQGVAVYDQRNDLEP